METVTTICGAMCGLLISYVFLFFSDRFWDTPRWLRTGFTLAGLGLLAGFGVWWMNRWVWRRRDSRAMANLVQKHHRRLGDRLLGIVELADERRRPADISPALCRAAIEQVSAEAARFDFREAVATRGPKIYLLSLLFLFSLVAVPWLVVPQAGWNALLRWVFPVSSTARYTFVSLDQLPARQIVPHGEAFEIPCLLSFNSFWRPTRASFQYENQPPVQVAVRGNHALFRVPGQTQNGVLTLRVGDDARRIAVVPTFRPELKNLAAQIKKPDYLGYPVATEEVRNGSLSLLEGSRIAFRGEVNRTLSEASLDLSEASTTRGDGLQAKAGENKSLRIQNNSFTSESLNLEDATRCAFRWRDNLGLTAKTPWPLSLQWQKDLEPMVRCPDLAAATAMLEDEVLEIKLESEDDFGIRNLGVNWECFGREQQKTPLSKQEIKIRDGSFQEKKIAASYRFCPSALRVPAGSTVMLCALASDYFPSREKSRSFLHRIYVLSREEHARLIEQQFETLLAQLEELTRKQDALNNDSRQTRELPKEKLEGEEAEKKLNEQSAEQSEQAEKLEQLIKEWTESLREALRNPDLSEETLRELTQHLQTLKNLAQQMQEASKALKQSHQNAADRAKKLDRAIELQKEILRALQEMQKKMGNSLDDMLAKNLAQRLRKVARFEKETSKQLEKMWPETVGKRSEELSGENQELTAFLATGQDLARKESQVLQEEIDRYFQRTQLANYGEVAKQMTESKTTEGLSHVAELIKKNEGQNAMQEAAGWSQRFSQWADRLGSGDRSRAAAEMQGGTMSEQEMKEMLKMLKQALALMRIRQQEETLRERTRMSEEQKANNPNYKEDAQALASMQQQLKEEIQKLQKEMGDSSLAGQLEPVAQAMGEAGSLLGKPQTDEPTVEAETRAIDQLTKVLNAMMSQCQGGQGGQCMGILMQMMGMGNGTGRTGGGSTAGGTTDQSNMAVTGNVDGKAADPRAPEKTSGRESKPLPMEFRDALQGYFNAIEQNSPVNEN